MLASSFLGLPPGLVIALHSWRRSERPKDANAGGVPPALRWRAARSGGGHAARICRPRGTPLPSTGTARCSAATMSSPCAEQIAPPAKIARPLGCIGHSTITQASRPAAAIGIRKPCLGRLRGGHESPAGDGAGEDPKSVAGRAVGAAREAARERARRAARVGKTRPPSPRRGSRARVCRSAVPRCVLRRAPRQPG